MSDLDELVRRAKTWPEQAQAELEQLARDIETELNGGMYRATADELRAIDEGLADAAAGNFVSEAEVKATFAKYRK
jgi:predicted transcriptional regulator